MEGALQECEGASEEQAHKKGRHRKKQLYTSVLQQMEFYFSDSNLTKDRFLSKLIEENPNVSLDIFLKFNKIRKLGCTIEDIRKAVQKSSIIELSEDKNSIRRKQPIKQKPNVEECTLYVEQLKSDATHDWVTSIFSEFGNVDYVSIPRYKHNNAIKGFAFIEFETEKEAQNALNYFESIGCKMPSNIEPEQLRSISTFDGTEKELPHDDETKKRKIEEIGGGTDSEDKAAKKAKVDTAELSESEDSENKKKKKLKKEHKKRNYIKELGLQVLSKKEWKKMRNRYLDLQRKKMQEFKRHLHKSKFSQVNYEEKFKKPSENEKTKDETLPKMEFIPGVIVKMKLPTESCLDVKKLKNEIKSNCIDAKYIDIPNPGSEECFIRFSNTKSASNFCSQENGDKRTLLEGEEERLYWDKILRDRQEKFEKTKKKQRGRDKLLKKANKVKATHIKFDD